MQGVAQTEPQDSAAMNVIDSTLILSDTSALDSARLDSLGLLDGKPKRKSTLEHEVNYQADDSMLIDLDSEKVYLYGNAIAEYGDIKLEAAFIEISLNTSELVATGMPDSNGDMAGLPVFTQGAQTFDSEEMRYNFKTQRGLSKTVKTQEGEGYLHGTLVKKDTGNVIYIKNGKYTTCEYDDPHFHIHAGKLKVITEDKIITGPAFLAIADIPTPLAVPFGFFPNNEKRSNGLIIPTWGESQGQGFFLSRGGYYFGLKDRIDFAITGDIYSRGSWATYADSRYAKKYRYNGSVGFELVRLIFSEPEYPDYFKSPLSYRLKWRHNQDPKAKPGRTFSADVDFGSPRASRYNLQSDANTYLRSNVNSNIRYTKTFANTPFTLNAAASSSQNATTNQVNMRLPNASLTMARIFPFKSKDNYGDEAPWEKIGMNASLEGANQVESDADSLFTSNTLQEMENGLQLKNQISAGYKLLKYFTLTPSISNRFVGYRTTVRREYNADSGRVDETTVNGANGYWEGNGSLALSTVFYGIYTYKSEVVKAMRHQATPSISVGYKPDYSKPRWGYYSSVQTDSFGTVSDYSYFAGGIYGAPGAQENGVVNFSFANTFELKVRDLSDSTETDADKKLRLLDAFNFATSYNIAKDSNRWSPVRVSVRTTVIPGFTLNGSATLDPYARNPNTGLRVAAYQYDVDGKLGTWTSANAALTWSLQPKDKKKKTEDKKDKLQEQNLYYDDFVDFDIPWKLNITYNIGYSKSGPTENVNQNLDLRGDVSVTQNWKVGFQTSYDIANEEFAYTSLDVYRNLHCWEFRLGVVPFGARQSYNFQINVKSAILQDLKLSRNRSYNVPVR